MAELVCLYDVLLFNEGDADKVFGIQALETDVTAGQVSADHCCFVCEQLARRFSSGDFIMISVSTAEALKAGDVSGRVKR